MSSIFDLKELSVTETPLFLFTFQPRTGAALRWCTHHVEVDGEVYEARIIGHNLFDMRTDSEEGVDGISKLTVTLANADSFCSEIERTIGWKGTKATVRFLFFDLKTGTPVSESVVVFRGVANSPDETTESTLRLTVSNRMSLQRLLVPEVRIQRRCPWNFPATLEQRTEAVDGGARGKRSLFYRCGYSPDIANGTGNLNGGVPFASCNYTRAQCQARGMFDTDTSGRHTRRFGGIEFVPAAVEVRSYGEKSYHFSAVSENASRYNDFVPVVYGTAWCAPPIVFARNDGNLTHVEVLLGMGEINGVLKVLVNDIEIPLGQPHVDMTGTGWYSVVTHGGRNGGFNLDFTDSAVNPLGDPYGSMAFMSLVVPNRVNDGTSLPKVQVLVEGLKLQRYDVSGASLGEVFDNNPAWVILDILKRCGWTDDEIDLASFAQTASYCAETIDAQDLFGNLAAIPRFQCNLVLRKRRSAADIVRGIRTASRLYLAYSTEGKLQLRSENSLGMQQPCKPAGSNSTEPLNGGWPSYEFGDGTFGTSGILRKENGEAAIRLYSRSTADTPNRYCVEFQDAFNEYQQDSLSLVDIDDVAVAGQEITGNLTALGLPNFSQAARVIRLLLNKSVLGSIYIQFETSVRAVGLKPGDIITLTYLKEGYQRQPFRITAVSPGLNYWTSEITAQIHDDAWYTDEAAECSSGTRRRTGAAIGLPRPLLGDYQDEDGESKFSVEEDAADACVVLKARFVTPRQPSESGTAIPLLSLFPTITESGGTLEGSRTYYYAVSATEQDGTESSPSFLVRATIPFSTNTNAVRLNGLSFAPSTAGFNVYRGRDTVRMHRIATAQPVAATFTDTGLASQLEAPSDEHYDHANFYWRYELQPEVSATTHTRATIGNVDLEMPANEYRGGVVRITEGTGKGQERTVVSNTATELTVAPAWTIEPDASSVFVVAEGGWQFGAMCRVGPARFEVPNHPGMVIHISGRSANVNDQECSYGLSPLTRWRIGDGSGLQTDTGVPGRPTFGLHPAGQGTVELVGLGFAELVNTRTISAGTLALNYWDELDGVSNVKLGEAVDTEDTSIHLSETGGAAEGTLVQVEGEVMRVTEVLNGGLCYIVERGMHRTAAEPHSAGSTVENLRRSVYVLPFPKEFFGSPASGSYSFPIFLPHVRIASAELTLTNAKGTGEPGEVCLTTSSDYGLRTLCGGQLSIQVGGYLAVCSDVAPPMIVEEAHCVRDISAVLREAPQGGNVELRLRRGEEEYCRLLIQAGSLQSNTVSGLYKPALNAGSQMSLDILSVPGGGSGTPGRDLTVTIRL
jgi:hypothetical protein